MRKLGLYLGLVEDDEEGLDGRDRRYSDDAYDDDDREPVAATSRRWAPSDDLAPTTALRRAPELSGSVRTRGSVALDTSLRPHRLRRTTRATGSPPCTRAPTTRRGRSASTSAAARR
jgi:hypothetical protein